MATWYIDPVGGNDANTFASYAQRGKTVAALTSGKGLAAGDTIQLIETAATALSSSATWTNGSPTITLGASVTQIITDCETAWTASANVTSTASTTSPREGTKVAQHVIAAAFTTGLASYYATGTLDLSGYQQVSFWFKTSVACASGDFSLKLCTDTAGVTAAHTITVPAVSITNQWVEVTVDTGGAMNSAIKSVALYQNVDYAVTISLDNILACKATSSVDALTLHSLIGKTSGAAGQWFAIRSINGTTVILDPGVNTTTNYGYYGTTETVTTYRMEPHDAAIAASTSTAACAVQVAGTPTAPITLSGGWTAASSMATQAGYTAFSMRGGSGVCFSNNAKANVVFTNLIATRSQWGFVCTASNSSRNEYTDCQATSTTTVAFYFNGTFANGTASSCYSAGTGYGVLNAAGEVLVKGGALIGASTTNGAINSSAGSITVLGSVIANNVTAFTSAGAPIYVYNGTCSGNTTVFQNTFGAAKLFLDNTAYSSNTNVINSSSTLNGMEAHFRNYNATAGDHRIYTESSVAIFDTSTYPTGGQGGSWKLSPTTTNRTAYYPIIVPIKPGPLLRANQPVTIKGQYKRDSANITASVVVKGGYLNGISTDQTATLSAAAGTWATFSITVTPTVTGFPQIELQCYDGTGTTNSAWFYLLPPG